MIQALFQTISNFFIDLPSISDLFSGIKTGETDIFSGLVSTFVGLFNR